MANLTHIYDGDNRRVERQATDTVRYVWDGQNIHLKLDGSNSLLDSYLYEPRQFGNLVCTNLPAYHHYDGLGSTRQITDNTGALLNTYNYGDWGYAYTVDKENMLVDPFLFVGRQGYYCDNEGIHGLAGGATLPYYARGRFYWFTYSRWMNQDPLRMRADWQNATGDAAAWLNVMRNLYEYVGNNPINATDPSGLLFGFNYGNFCGWSKKASCPPGTSGVKPMDALDAACEKHDCCQASWWTCNPYHIWKCSVELCFDAMDAQKTGCDKSPDPAACKAAASKVKLLFCFLGGIDPTTGNPIPVP